MLLVDVGGKADIGGRNCSIAYKVKLLDPPTPERARGVWTVWNDTQKKHTRAPGIEILGPQRPIVVASASSDCVVVGERTREEKDAEARKHAIDVDEEPPRKRSRAAADQLEARVATARSTCDASIEKRSTELAQAAFAEYMGDKIDEAELGKRKKAAREQATRENEPLGKLDRAFAAYTAAVKARVAAEANEDAAEAALEAALAPLEAASSKAGASSANGVKVERR